ncbi:50S ribosomal protein L35 [Candidatus Daviesbacteria bacterium]|nr:50S ribosomal protein L35 [Candidatus Daviesbacteria bacterium]
MSHSKQKTKKAFTKRFKVTTTGKILRRHQLGSGHLKRNKTKGALERHKKVVTLFKGEARTIKKLLGA